MLILIARLALAAVSGALAFSSYEPIGWWPAAIAAMALLYVSFIPWGAQRPSLRFGTLLGFIHALVMYLFALPWIGEFVGNLPYIALAIACALYGLLTGWAGTAVARLSLGWLLFPLVYVAVEFARSSWPFGGFPWVRLAWGQINGPIAYLAAWGGPALVSFATVLLGTALVMLLRPTAQQQRSQRIQGAAVTIAVLLIAVGAGTQVNREAATTGTVRVAAIQGNVPRMGLDFNAQRRAVLANHVRVTEELAANTADGERPEIVIWPENSSDVNPFADAKAAALINRAVQSIETPVLVGTITQDHIGSRNTMQVFDPHTGAGEYHHKIYLQPFGEYMPMREFFRLFSEYVDMAGNFQPGNGDGTVSMNNVVLGVATCYEISFDTAARDAVRNGAQILTTPTNNATFGFTDMTYQQLAMSRMRAIETDRAVIVAATSGVSAMVHPDGTVSQDTEIFEPAYLLETLPLRDSVTFAVRYGQWIEWFLVAGGLTAGIAGVWIARRAH